MFPKFYPCVRFVRGPPLGSTPPPKDKIKEPVLYSISEDYFDARRGRFQQTPAPQYSIIYFELNL
jgi:hypothetical protein